MNTAFLHREPSLAARVSAFARLVAAPSERPLNLSLPVLPARSPFRGDREYLRAVREAEMKAWQASGGDALNLSATP